MSFKNVILASASPRRQELLKLIFEDFDICPSGVEELLPENIATDKGPEYLAKLKAFDIAKKYPESLVIGADTSVIIENTVLGKPKSESDAKNMLTLLSGKTHKVITGCALVFNGKSHCFSVSSSVKFYDLSEKEINDYILTGEPFDKAGAYGIQRYGALLVEKIDGDYFNIVGLPVASLKRELEKFL